MREYGVRIRETLERTITVEAESAMQAREMVEQQYRDEAYVLDASDFTGVVFTVPARSDRER